MKQGGRTGKKPGILLAFFLWGKILPAAPREERKCLFTGSTLESFFTAENTENAVSAVNIS